MTGADDLDFTRRAISHILFTIESLLRTLSTRFEPLYMNANMYVIGPLDGAVPHYMLWLIIYGAAFVTTGYFCFVDTHQYKRQPGEK